MPNVSKLSEKELVELLKNGSQTAFEQLYFRYRNHLINLCTRYLNDEETAKDIVQDIFMQLWETHEALNADLSFGGYVCTLAHNRVLNMLRHFDVHSDFARNIILNGKETTNETEDTILDNDYATLLKKILESLSPKQKEIFRLSRMEGLSYKEISELLHISVDTIQEHVSHALKIIKKQLRQHADIHLKTLLTLLFLNF